MASLRRRGRRAGPRRRSWFRVGARRPAGNLAAGGAEAEAGPRGPLAFLRALDPPISPEAESLLVRLEERLDDWAAAGLTGFRSRAGRAEFYFREAIALRGMLPPSGRILDIGSGGGTPALPLAACLPDTRWTLLEPRRTPAVFLEDAARELGLAERVAVVRRRLGAFLADPDGGESEPFLAATMRAVRLSRPEWRGLARLLAPHGFVVWPTSLAARERAAIPAGTFAEEARPAGRGIVWIGRPKSAPANVSCETSNPEGDA